MTSSPAQFRRNARPAPAVLGHCVGLFARYVRSPYSPTLWPSIYGTSPFIDSNHTMADQATKPVGHFVDHGATINVAKMSPLPTSRPLAFLVSFWRGSYHPRSIPPASRPSIRFPFSCRQPSKRLVRSRTSSLAIMLSTSSDATTGRVGRPVVQRSSLAVPHE